MQFFTQVLAGQKPEKPGFNSNVLPGQPSWFKLRERRLCWSVRMRAAERASSLSIAKIKSPVGSSCGRWAPRCCHQRPRPRPAGGGSGWPHAAAGWGVAGRSILRGPTPDGTDLKPPQRKKKQKTNVLAHLPVYSSTIVRNTWFKWIKWR